VFGARPLRCRTAFLWPGNARNPTVKEIARMPAASAIAVKVDLSNEEDFHLLLNEAHQALGS